MRRYLSARILLLLVIIGTGCSVAPNITVSERFQYLVIIAGNENDIEMSMVFDTFKSNDIVVLNVQPLYGDASGTVTCHSIFARRFFIFFNVCKISSDLGKSLPNTIARNPDS